MFGISGEHLVILGIILLVLGPRRLPQIGHSIGKAVRNFKDSLEGIKEPPFRRLEENSQAASPTPTAPVAASSPAQPENHTPPPAV